MVNFEIFYKIRLRKKEVCCVLRLIEQAIFNKVPAVAMMGWFSPFTKLDRGGRFCTKWLAKPCVKKVRIFHFK